MALRTPILNTALQLQPWGASTSTVFALTNNDFSRNLRNDGTGRRSALDGVPFNTNAAYVDVEYYNSRLTADHSQFGISATVGGTFDSFFLAEGVGTFTQRVNLSGSGSRLVELMEGVQQHDSQDLGTFGYTSITKLTFPAGSTASLTKPAAKSDVLIVNGDSISVGVFSTVPQRYSWIPRLRALRTGMDVYSDGYGYKTIFRSIPDSSTRAAIIANAKTTFGQAPKKRYYFALGTNDMFSENATTTVALVAAFADEMKVQIPDVIFYIQTPLDYPGSASFSASTQTAWRNALAGVRTGRETFVRIVDGVALSTQHAYADGLHPNDAGYLEMANGIHAVLDAANVTGPSNEVYSPVLLHAWEGGNTGAVWVDSGTSGQNASQSVASRRPTLVDGAVFGKRAYYFENTGLQRLELPPLATQAAAYTLIFTFRSTSQEWGQFLFDCEIGRIAVFVKGLDAMNTGEPARDAANNTCYYLAAQGGDVGGLRGVKVNGDTDTFVAVALGLDNGELTINDQLIGNYPAGVTRLQSMITLGAAFSNVEGNTAPGRFFGYLGAVEIHPGKLTPAQVQARRTVLIS